MNAYLYNEVADTIHIVKEADGPVKTLCGYAGPGVLVRMSQPPKPTAVCRDCLRTPLEVK